MVIKQLILPHQANHQVFTNKVNGYHKKGVSKYVEYPFSHVKYSQCKINSITLKNTHGHL